MKSGLWGKYYFLFDCAKATGKVEFVNIGVIGGGRCSKKNAQMAEDVGRELAGQDDSSHEQCDYQACKKQGGRHPSSELFV